MTSIWYLLAFIPIAIGFTSVALSRRDRAIGRAAFLVRLFVLFVFGIALSFILRRRDEDVAVMIMLLYISAGWFVVPYWATARQRDIGMQNKYWAVLTVVPVIGWIYTIYLMFAKSAADPVKEEDEDLPPLVVIEEPEAIEAPPAHTIKRIAS